MNPLDSYIKERLDSLNAEIGRIENSDVISILGQLLPGMDLTLRKALELHPGQKSKSITVILDTPGGVIGVVERMVTELRFNYARVSVIVPDKAMSAGTILALSADRILMDHFSCLGPIDPQIEKDGQLVPALAYLNQFDRLNNKSAQGTLTSAEYALVSKLDPADLYRYEQAAALSMELAEKWLSEYMFKDMKGPEKMLATEIAKSLNDHEKWRSHDRGISMETLREEVRLPVENLADTAELHERVRSYSELIRDYARRQGLHAFVHSRGFF